ncbi:MAG: hypothetical protein ABIP51_15820 [Bacteroidia bacterium]
MKVAFSSFRSYLTGPGKAIIFTSLFYSFWLVISQVISTNFDLNSFSGRTIGLATLDGIGVEERIALFYKCILLFFVSFSAFIFISHFFFKKIPALLNCAEAKIINYTSLAGIFIFLFKVFNSEVYETLEIIYFLHKLMLTAIILRMVFSGKSEISVYQLTIILALSVSGYFFIADLNNLAGYTKNPDFYFVTFVIGCLLLISLNLFLRTKNSVNKQNQLRLMAHALLPLLILSFVSVLKDEIFLVFKANGILLHDQLFIYLALLALLAVVIVLRYKKGQTKELRSDKEQAARGYFPLLIFSLTAYVSYSYYTEYYDEIFESGNVYLPIMEHKLFGTLSPIEKLNTHLLSDYFFAAIYTFFNGLKINEITLYDFFLAPISYTLYYYLLRFLTRNEFVALFCILLFPYAEAIMPEGFCLAIIGIFALVKVLGPGQSIKNYIIYFITIILLALWRIDLGYNCLLTMPLILFYFNFRDIKYKINWKLLLKAGAIVAGSMIVLIAVLSIYRQVNFFAKATYLLNYCASAQSYSYGPIGDPNLSSYKMHYIIFPACVALIIVLLVIKYKQISRTNSQRLAYLSLLFMCLFYFINFNRGLTRHSLLEGSDVFTSSFIYLILGSSAFVFLKKENYLVRSIVFFMILFVFVNAYKVPDTKGLTSLFEKIERKIKTTQNSNLAKIESRIKNAPNKTEVRHKEFSDFIKKETKADETFIDFSNRPMLYFFSEKITPSWFYQNPLCVQNDFLQEKFIEDLKEYKTPYLLFSGITPAGYDVIDDVPNTIRHYRMAEYFYNNYKPYVIVENLCVWKNNDKKDNNKKDTICRYNDLVEASHADVLSVQIKAKPGKVYSVRQSFTHKTTNDLILTTNGSRSSISVKNINETSSYAILDLKEGKYTLDFLNSDNTLKDFFVIESDYTPDFISEKFISYDLKKLAYIWGTYDEFCNEEKPLFENTKTKTIENNEPYKISIPAKIDRSSGNTIIIKCKSDKEQKVSLSFGNSKKQGKTTFLFNVIASEKEQQYAIRVSSSYKWYSGDVNEISLLPETGKSLTILKILVTKGK